MTRYLIIMEPTPTGYAAYSPDLPGCVSTGRTKEEVESSMREAINAHVAELRAGGDEVPEPTSLGAYVEVVA